MGKNEERLEEIYRLENEKVAWVGKISDDERRKYPPMREKVSEGG